ncbi:MAG TPA: hypothetical protein VJV03_08540 [Pyrinomonadaceae bacterium]|nr:hypothetical protein [Pyrinomonadaceae bacterium]
MSLGSYAGEVYRIAEELLDDIPHDDIEIIHRELKGLGINGWCDWKANNLAVVCRYVESTPSQRAKLKLFQPLQPLLALAAFQECLAGYNLLLTIESHNLFPGGSYRIMARRTAEAFRDVYTLAVDEYWPWPWLESPFFDDRTIRGASQ